jgi:hypothetical protein
MSLHWRDKCCAEFDYTARSSERRFAPRALMSRVYRPNAVASRSRQRDGHDRCLAREAHLGWFLPHAVIYEMVLVFRLLSIRSFIGFLRNMIHNLGGSAAITFLSQVRSSPTRYHILHGKKTRSIFSLSRYLQLLLTPSTPRTSGRSQRSEAIRQQSDLLSCDKCLVKSVDLLCATCGKRCTH